MIKRLFLFMCIGLQVSCVSKPQAFFDYDKTNTFSSYKHFSWAHNPPLIIAGDLPVSSQTETRTTLAIKSQLEQKGFSFTDNPEDADFLVVYTLGARENISVLQGNSDVYTNKENWLWGKKYHSYYFDMVVDQELTRGYTKGVLAIDIFDTDSNAPVWHAKASKVLDSSEITPRGDGVEAAVEAVLSGFPPK